MNDLLKALGRRVRELREAKKWSQEEFAHIAGFHRTYIGQVERGEKNLSFTNLTIVADVLGLSISQLLEDLGAASSNNAVAQQPAVRDQKSAVRYNMAEVQRLVGRLGHQRSELDRTIQALEELVAVGQRKGKNNHDSSLPRFAPCAYPVKHQHNPNGCVRGGLQRLPKNWSDVDSRYHCRPRRGCPEPVVTNRHPRPPRHVRSKLYNPSYLNRLILPNNSSNNLPITASSLWK